MPRNFVGEPFSVSLTSGIEKLYASAGYVTIFDFLLKTFCLTVPKKSVVESFTVALFPGTDKDWIGGGARGGISRFSVENFMSHSAEKFRWESFTVALTSGTEKVWRRGG